MWSVLQSRAFWAAGAGSYWACAVGVAAFQLSADPPRGTAHPAVRTTALFAVGAWGMVAVAMLRARAWGAGPGRGLLRVVWPLAWSLFLIHVAAAFHFAHGWSHSEAFRHVEETSGVGGGIFVSYLFALVWGVDAMWLAARPDGYVRRPRGVALAVHGFLAFVTFNATVVYGAGLARWGGAAMFAVLGFWLARRRSVS